jgi:aminoglycoside/choline kinase family phosphotransferase
MRPPDPERARLSAAFVAGAGWAEAQRGFLAGDASNRSYDRLVAPGGSAVLMDAPPARGEDVAPFIAIAAHLRAIGLSAPEVLAADRTAGFLLLEDLGDDLYARVLERDPGAAGELYAAAVDVLAHLQSHAAPEGLAAYGVTEMAEAAALAVRWYARAITGAATDPGPLRAAVADTLAAHADAPAVIVLRDYHAENLIWLPRRAGLARVGLLDFQLAEMGQPEYDLVSLAQDARRDVSPQIAAGMITRFADRTGRSAEQVARACAVLGAQRGLRILGAFARLSLHYGKPGYVRLIPRVWGQVQANLAHPALAPLRAAVARDLPPPTPEALRRIVELCGTVPTP